MYYPHWSVGNSHQEDEPAPLVVDSSGATPGSVDADGTSTLPVNTAGTSAASQGAHLSVNTCDTCVFCAYIFFSHDDKNCMNGLLCEETKVCIELYG